MKRHSLTSIARIFALLLVLFVVVAVLASCGSTGGISGGDGKAAVVDNDPHSMGYRKLTPEEYEKIKDRVVQLDQVSPNEYSKKLKMEELKKEGRQVTKDALRTPPSSVDHSTSTYMPPVSSQAYQGSCGCFSTSYYYKTYQEARDNNWTPNITSRQMSPAFTYNQLNGGSDSGSNPLEAMVLIADKGNATWADMPYDQSPSPNYTYWPSETAWRNAIPYRGQYAGTIDISADSGINTLKQWVANGDMAVIGFQVYDNFYTQYHGGSNPTYKFDNDVIYGNAGVYKGGHAVTVVGYDDNRAYNDGTGTKYGAFKLVNSWGTGWGVSGYFWFSYSYMKSLTDKAAWFMCDKYRYQPTIIGVFGISHPARYDLTIQMGIGPTGSPAYNKTFFSEDGGDIAISSANKIAVDLSDGWNGITSGTNQNYFLRVANYASGDTGAINYMAVEYQGTTVSTETPKSTVSGSYVYVNLTKNVTKTNRTIDLTSPAGGETWGGLHSIAWNTGGSDWTAGDQVIIEYSPNGGNTWQNLGIVAYNAASLRGSFSWDTSSLDNTAQGKIRISYKTIQQINEASGNFTLTNGPPAITARDATSLTNNSATLNADVLPGTSSTTVKFQWGLTTSYGNETTPQDIGTGNVYEPVSQGITGLSGATTYNFRAVAQNGSGTTYGANGTFRTTAAPASVTGVASSIGLNQATLNGTVNPNGLSTSAWLEWGETDSYGNSTTHQDIGSGTSAVAVSQGINGLTFETTYHFRVVGQNSIGTTYGNDNTFITISPFPYTTGGGIYSSSPAIGSDGNIYIGSDDKKLHALNPDGTPKWQYTTGGMLRSSPSIGPDGTLYIGGIDDKKLYAVNSDGSFKWSYLTGNMIYSSPAVTSDSTIYFGSYDYKLYALNSNGSLKWQYGTGGGVYSSPAVGPDGKIFFGSIDKYIYALNTNGSLAWRWATTGAIYSSPAINSEGVIYFGSANQSLYALNYDGTLKWSYGTGGLINSSPVIGPDGTIYFGSNDNKLNALNSNGTIKWSYATGGLVRSVPAVSSTGTIYFGSDDDKVYALNSNGSFKWSYLTGGDVISSPAIDSAGRVYVGSLDGKLYRLAGDTALAGTPWPKFRNNNKNNGLTSLPVTPTNLAAATVSATQINLSWSDNSGDETGFKIERKTGAGSYAQVDTVGPGQNTYNDEGLTPFTTFYYRVRAYNAAGNSTYSGEANATTLRMVPNITGISPAQSACGAVVTITGAYFGASQGAGTVTFNGIDAGTAGSWSDTEIVITVPGQASSGHVIVTVGGEACSPYQYAVLPAVDNITPPQQVTGGVVTITGSGFGSPQGTSTIAINGVNTTAATWNTNQITVTVPAAASTGDVIVTVGGNAGNARTLTVIPHIDGIQPGSLGTGNLVTISGSGFGAIQGTTAVFFNGINADLAASWSNTRITIDVPADATTGNVKVVKETDSNEVAFTVLPTVDSFSPGTGVVGEAVTITGTGFGTIQGSVSIGGAQAPVQSWTNTSIVAAVPAGSDQQSDFISITNSEGNSHQSAAQFTIDPPSITGITPDSGRAGEEITINGNNFGAQKPAWLEFPVKFFDSVNASVVSWSDTQVKVNVPAAANGGKISLQTAGGTAQSPGQFTVLISVEVTTSIGAGTSVLIDGAEFGAPYTTAWIKGSSHDIGVNSPQTPETGKRYLYDSWSDGGGQTHTVSPSADAVYNAGLNTQYYLTVETGPANLPPIPGEGWYDEGQSVNLSAGSPVDYEGTAYYFSEWKVDDAPAPGNPISFQMTSAKTAKAEYQSVDHFEIGNIPGPQTAGQQFPVTITAKDASSATITGFTGTASLSDSTGTLLPGGTDSFAGGVWTGSLTITGAQAAVVVTVSASGKTGSSNAFNVDPGALDHFDISNIASPQTAGLAFSVTLTAQDVYNNTVTSFTSSADISDTTGTIGPATTTAFTAGVWTGDVAITKSEAGVSVTATASGKSGTGNQFDVNYAGLDHFNVSNIASPQTAGQAFSVTLTAQDVYDNTVTSFTSTAAISDITGTVAPSTTTAFTAGVWTGDLTVTGAGTNNTITASASGKSGTSNAFNVDPGVLDHFVVSNIASPQTAGQAFSVTLTAQDAYDNTVTSFTSTAAISDITGTVAPSTTTAFTAGVWTGDLTVTGVGTNNTITASASGKSGTSNQFDVNPGVLDHFVVSNIASPQTAGQAFGVTLTAQDANNNTVTSFTSTASLTDTTGTITPVTTTAFTAGAWTGDLTVTGAGTNNTITASASGKSGTSNAFNVDPGVLDHFGVSNIASPQTAGQAFGVTLTAQDANNNTVTSFTSTASLTDTTGTITPATTTAFTAGAWTGDLTVTGVGTNNTITASASGKSGTGNQFDVNPGVLDHFDVSNIASPQTAGQAFGVTLTAQDANNNTVTSFTNTASLTDTTGTINPATTDAFTAGAWTGSVTITGAQPDVQVTATASGKSGTSNQFDVNPGVLDHFNVSNIVSPQTAGQAFGVTLTAQDANNNTVTSFTNTASLADTTGTMSPGATTAFTAGVWTGDVAITKSEAGVSVTTTASGKSGTSNQFDVNPGALDHFDVSNVASPQTAGQAFGVTLTAQDANNNTVTSFTSTASLTDTTGTMSPGATTAFTAGVWAGSVTITGAQSDVQITATASGKSGASSQFDVNPGVLDHFNVSNVASPQTAGQAFGVTVTAQDANNNTVTSFTDTASLTDTTGTINPVTTDAFTAGAWTGSITITGAQSDVQITATASGKSGISSQFDVDPGVLDHFNVSNVASPQTAGQAFGVTLTAQDANNNTVTSFTNTASLTDTTGTISPGATTAFTAGVWTGDVAITKSGAGVSVTASASGKSGTSNTFNVDPDVLDHFNVSNVASPQIVGQEFNVTLTAQDANNNTVTSFTDTASLTDTTGTINPVTTDAFTAGAWTGSVTITGAQPDVQVTATASGKSGTGNQFDVEPAGLHHFLISNIGSPQTAGQPFSVTLTAQDAHNNTVTSFTSTAAVSDITGTAAPSATTAFTAGVWTGDLTVTGAGTNNTITASASGKSGTSNQFDVNPGALDHFDVSNVASPQTAGQAFGVTLTAQDANNNTVTSFTNTASLTDTTGTMSPGATTAFTAGVWAGSVTITDAQPDVQITTTASGKTGTSSQFDVNPGVLDHFNVSNIVSPQTAGQAFGVTLTAQDANNNTVTLFTNTASLADTTGTINPVTTDAFTAGAWTGSITITAAQSNVQVTATASGKSGTSNQFDVNPGVLDHFDVSNVASPQTAGQAFGVTLTAQDANNNTVTSFTNTASLADTTGTINPVATDAFTAGVWAGNVTITSAQPDVQVTATASGKSGTSSQFDVNPGVLDHFNVSNIASPQTAGQAFSVTFTAQDANNNTVTSFTSTASLTDTTGTINPATTDAFTAGAWTGSVTITAAQSDVQVTATASGKSGMSNQFDVNSAGLHHFAFNNVPSPVTAGQPFSVAIEAKDNYDNTVTGFTDTAELTDSTGTIVINATTGSFASGVWTGTVTITKAQTGVTLTAAASGKSGTSNSFDVNSGSLDHFSFENISSPQAAGQAFGITVTAKDSNDNTVTSFNGTADLTDITGTINPTTTGAFTSGAWTGNVTITGVSASDTITATASGKSGTSNQFAVNHAGLDHFSFGNISSPQAAGQPFGITITAEDIYNNTVTSFVSNANLTDSTGTIVVNAVTGNFTSGVWSGNVTITKAQSAVTMTATAQGKQGTSNAFDVNSSGLDHFVISNIGSPQVRGVAFPVSITAEDAYGNTVSGFGGTAALSITSGSMTPVTTGAFTAGVWSGNLTVNSSGTGLVITAESSGKDGTSNTFNVEEPPALSVTPLSLTFDAVEGQANPQNQEVDVSNTGGGTLGFTVNKAGNWLTVSPLSGNAPQALTASVDITGMTAGAYNGTITVTGSPGTENSPQVVNVTLNIAPPPYLEVSPQTADFTAMKGWTEPADKTVNVTNSGGGTLSYTVNENVDWLNITPLSGTAPDTLTLSATITGLEVGTYSTIVTITGAGNCQNSPQYVNVNAEVTEPPEISLTPISFTFNTIVGAGAPPDQNLQVNNSGGNVLNWTASVDAGWLSVLPASGTAPSNAVVSVKPAGLSAGTYNDVITITGGGGTTNSPQTVPVTLNIAVNQGLPYEDGFEDYATGGYPSPYFTPILSGQPPNAGVISEDYAWLGTKSFRQNGGALTPRLDMFPLSSAAGNYITFEIAFYIPEGESSTLWIGFGQYSGGSVYTNNAGLRVEGGHIYCGADDLGEVAAGTWHPVISKCNFITGTMEVTIDGDLKGYDLPMADTAFNGFGLYTKNGPAYFDDVHILEGTAPETVDVWPGDLNNDGDADTFDILNVGAYWNETGYERSPQSSAWAAQNARKWDDTNATYADANGDGVVDADDITPVLTNYGLVHTLIITGAAALLTLAWIPLLTGIIKRKKDR